MKNIRKTLGQLFAAQEDDDNEVPNPGKEGSTADKDETAGDEKTDSGDEKSTDGDEKKETGAGDDKKADGDEKELTAGTAGTVVLALDDYNKLIGLASDAKEARADAKEARKANAGLKAKADQWDSYQAALSGGKPLGDSAGADADENKEEKDPNAGLRSKYGALMADV